MSVAAVQTPVLHPTASPPNDPYASVPIIPAKKTEAYSLLFKYNASISSDPRPSIISLSYIFLYC